MLKTEHLIFRINSPDIKPKFIDINNIQANETAQMLINIYLDCAANRADRGETAEFTAAAVRGCSDIRFAAGLNKLLLDRTDFAVTGNIDHAAARKEIFLKSAEMIKNGDISPGKLSACRNGDFDIYGDLPEFEKISSFRNCSAQELLEHYNLAQAQGLLCHTREVELKLKKCDMTSLRKLMKTIKFFRLLAEFSMTAKDTVLIKISGPFAMFENSSKYAVQLANLLPAVVNLPQWELKAAVRIKEKNLTLKLSQKNGLTAKSYRFGNFIPEEIKLFHRTFAEKQKEWQIVGNTPFLDAGNQEIIFPDLSFFSSENGKLIHAELFHRWHAGQLKKRIELLKKKPDLPLIIGIDRALVKDEAELRSLLDGNETVRSKCWLFRDFPGVSSTISVLKKCTGKGIF